MVKDRIEVRKEKWMRMDLEGEYSSKKPYEQIQYSFNCTMFRFDKDFLLKVVLKIKTPGQYRVTYVKDGKLKLKIDHDREVSATVGYGDLAECSIITTRPDEQVFLAMYELNGEDVKENFKNTSGLAIPIYIRNYVPSRL